MAKSKKTSTAKKTLVTFLLDSTGSMQGIKQMTIEGFNSYLANLKQAGEGILFNHVCFDSFRGIRKLHYEAPVDSVPELTDATYVCDGGTPLIEAAIKTIRALDAALPGKKDVDKIVVTIQTDGEENASGPEYTWDVLKALITERTKAGWQFNFIGSGIDAYKQGQRMGMATANTMSYDSANRATTQSAFHSMGANTRMYAAGLSGSTAYTQAQKTASGDQFDPLKGNPLTGNNPWVTPQPAPVIPVIPAAKPSQNLDLSTPKAGEKPPLPANDLSL